MTDDSLLQQVRQFLTDFRSVASSPKKLRIIERKDGKNQATRSALELTKPLIHEELMGLEPENYNRCDEDRDRPGSAKLWIFGKRIKGKEIYIKIKISSPDQAVCISFHEAESPMRYPLKTARK